MSTEFRTNRRTRNVYPTMTQGKQIPEYLRSIDPASKEYADILAGVSPAFAEKIHGYNLSPAARRQRERFRADDAARPQIQNYEDWKSRYPELSEKEARHQGIIGYNGWWNWDTWEADLILTNSQLSQRQLDYVGKRWLQYMKTGRFDNEEAKFYVWKYLIPAAQGKGPFAYQTEDGGQDPEIDRSKVNYQEIVDQMIDSAKDALRYEAENP